MKRLKALLFIIFAAGIASMGILPGCDELVTNEIKDSTSITLIVRDSSCVEYCHSDNNFEVLAAMRQWEYSGHADTLFYGDTLYGRTALYCGPQCHTMDGFISALDGSPDTSGYPFELWCYTCHQPHTAQADSSWDFSLRTVADVTLKSDDVFSFGTNGRSNICAQCHRLDYNVANLVVVGMLVDENWLREIQHASKEADMIMGAGGYEYSGYTYRGNSHENVIQGCLGCHQDYDEGFALGGHSLNIRDGNGNALVESCNRVGCHSDSLYTDSRIAARQNSYYLTQLPALRAKLIAAGLLDPATLLPPVEYAVIMNADSAGALYNYYYLSSDYSLGMHNMKYATDLLASSIAFLNGTLGK